MKALTSTLNQIYRSRGNSAGAEPLSQQSSLKNWNGLLKELTILIFTLGRNWPRGQSSPRPEYRYWRPNIPFLLKPTQETRVSSPLNHISDQESKYIRNGPSLWMAASHIIKFFLSLSFLSFIFRRVVITTSWPPFPFYGMCLVQAPPANTPPSPPAPPSPPRYVCGIQQHITLLTSQKVFLFLLIGW